MILEYDDNDDFFSSLQRSRGRGGRWTYGQGHCNEQASQPETPSAEAEEGSGDTQEKSPKGKKRKSFNHSVFLLEYPSLYYYMYKVSCYY